MKVKIKKLHKHAVIPRYAKSGDAGMDLTCTEIKRDKVLNKVTYHTGVAIEIPDGHVGLLFPRSSIHKTGMMLFNSVGVIDSGYRGEIMMKFKVDKWVTIYKIGDRIGQIIIVPYPHVEFDEVDELTDTERGSGGYGSTGQ